MHTEDDQLESFEFHDRGPRTTRLFSYLVSSLCAGATIWALIISVSFVDSNFEPVDVASAVLGTEQQVDDPMVIARDSELFLIEPAAGPAKGCE